MMQILTLPVSINGAKPDVRPPSPEPRPIPSSLSVILFNAISKIESTQYANSQYDSAISDLKLIMDLIKK